jgi:hypothetical protein
MRQAFHWGAPLAVSVLAVWLALGADRSEQALTTSPQPAGEITATQPASLYPEPNVDASQPPAPPAPTF